MKIKKKNYEGVWRRIFSPIRNVFFFLLFLLLLLEILQNSWHPSASGFVPWLWGGGRTGRRSWLDLGEVRERERERESTFTPKSVFHIPLTLLFITLMSVLPPLPLPLPFPLPLPSPSPPLSPLPQQAPFSIFPRIENRHSGEVADDWLQGLKWVTSLF